MTTATTTAAPAVKLKPKEYRSAIEPTWCPGCGDYAVTAAICNALSANGVDPDNAVIVSGIGCSSRLPLWMRTFGYCFWKPSAQKVMRLFSVSEPIELRLPEMPLDLA